MHASYHDLQTEIKAEYAAELVRQQLEQMYGDSIYTDGFNVYTTIDSHLQQVANQAVHNGLLTYDQRHGYRGPEQHWGTPTLEKLMSWKRKLHSMTTIGSLEPAVVLEVTDNTATAMRSNGAIISIPWHGLSWACKQIDADELGPMPKTAHDVLASGDVIYIMPNIYLVN